MKRKVYFLRDVLESVISQHVRNASDAEFCKIVSSLFNVESSSDEIGQITVVGDVSGELEKYIDCEG